MVLVDTLIDGQGLTAGFEFSHNLRSDVLVNKNCILI
jgi:hypothetical protein